MAGPLEPHPTEAHQLDKSAPGPGPGGVREAVGRATTRIEEIIDAAESVAEEIRSDAEAEGSRLLAERRAEADRLGREADALRAETGRLQRERQEALSGTTQSLLAELTLVRGAMVSAIAAVDHSIDAISSHAPRSSGAAASSLRPDPIQPWSPPAADTEDVPVEREPRYDPALAEEMPPPSPPTDSNSDEAMLRATQMAVAGSSRDEITRTLEAEFGIDDPESILGQILGPA
ncbi:MAG: hypothetical protein ABI726_10495 [bacterium]